MIELSPSILASDFSRLGEQLKEVSGTGTKWIHIDVMDGMFVPSISFGMPLISSIRKVSDLFFDTHLMIKEPIRYIDAFKKAGVDLLNVHVEACADVKATLTEIRNSGMKVGITLNPETDVKEVLPYVQMVDLVLVMSVHPGFGGQKFIPETLEKVKIIRETINRTNPECRLEIDGGITLSNVKEAAEAGADTIVAGTAVFGGNITENIMNFRKALL